MVEKFKIIYLEPTNNISTKVPQVFKPKNASLKFKKSSKREFCVAEEQACRQDHLQSSFSTNYNISALHISNEVHKQHYLSERLELKNDIRTEYC